MFPSGFASSDRGAWAQRPSVSWWTPQPTIGLVQCVYPIQMDVWVLLMPSRTRTHVGKGTTHIADTDARRPVPRINTCIVYVQADKQPPRHAGVGAVLE